MSSFGIYFIYENSNLACVHKIEDRHNIAELDAPHVDEGVVVRVLGEQVEEEGATGRQNKPKYQSVTGWNKASKGCIFTI